MHWLEITLAVIWIGSIFLTYSIAQQEGKNVTVWLILSLIFGPFAVAFVKNDGPTEYR